jgi:hypothetical protein
MDIKTTYKKETGAGARPTNGISTESDLLASIAMTLAVESRRGRESITIDIDMAGMDPEVMAKIATEIR